MYEPPPRTAPNSAQPTDLLEMTDFRSATSQTVDELDAFFTRPPQEDNPFSVPSGGPPQAASFSSHNNSSQFAQKLTPHLPEFLRSARNPVPCFFHLVFKMLTLMVYFFGGWIWGGNFVLTFIFCTLFLSIDFYVSQNITGRLLVGLRWWTKDAFEAIEALPQPVYGNSLQGVRRNKTIVDEKYGYVFETLADESSVDVTDKNLFWLGTYSWALIWSLLFLLNLLSLSLTWLLFLGIANSFAWVNLVAFWRCSSADQNKGVQNLAAIAMQNMGGLGLPQSAGAYSGFLSKAFQ